MHFKRLHTEWGYKFNESGKIEDLTTTQHRMIALAESAEAYIKEMQRKTQSGSVNTQSGIEHRESKQRRIAQAKQKHIQ